MKVPRLTLKKEIKETYNFPPYKVGKINLDYTTNNTHTHTYQNQKIQKEIIRIRFLPFARITQPVDSNNRIATRFTLLTSINNHHNNYMAGTMTLHFRSGNITI